MLKTILTTVAVVLWANAETPNPLCGPDKPAGDCWLAACSVSGEQIIKEGAGYDINSAAWPKLAEGGNVAFSGSKSMCTSATATAFLKHISDLKESGKLKLTPEQTAFLNGPTVKEILNGNTYSFALLNQYMGGQNIKATESGEIKKALGEAKAGDVFKFDRTKGTGHSTIFKEIKGDQFCYWSSNTRTKGVGEQCEPISSLKGVAISRLPNDDNMGQALDAAIKAPQLKQELAKTGNGSIQLNAVKWNDHLTCDTKGGKSNAGVVPSAGGTGGGSAK